MYDRLISDVKSVVSQLIKCCDVMGSWVSDSLVFDGEGKTPNKASKVRIVAFRW